MLFFSTSVVFLPQHLASQLATDSLRVELRSVGLLRPTCVFVRRLSRLRLASGKSAKINIINHLQTLSKYIFDSSRLRIQRISVEMIHSIILRLTGYTSVVFLILILIYNRGELQKPSAPAGFARITNCSYRCHPKCSVIMF